MIDDLIDGLGDLIGAVSGGSNRRGDNGCAVFAVIAIIVVVIVAVAIMFMPEKKKIESKPAPPKTETLSHKAGVAVRESGVEFFKGVVGMDSKLKKETEKDGKSK